MCGKKCKRRNIDLLKEVGGKTGRQLISIRKSIHKINEKFSETQRS